MGLLNELTLERKKRALNIDAACIIQKGDVTAVERYGGDRLHNVFSVSKSFTVTAVGICIDEGLLSLDSRPFEMFPESITDTADPRWSEVKLEHLLTMNTGHGKAWLMAKDREMLRGEDPTRHASPEDMADWMRYAFRCPMVQHPGEKTCYGNLAPYVAGRMVEKVTGMTMRDFLYERLWKIQRVDRPRWDPDTSGHTFPASFLFLDIVDMTKLGQLYLNGGVWDGQRIVSESWTKTATSRHVDSYVISPTGIAEDEMYGYGYYFWMCRYPGIYRAYGREGQFVIVIPEKEAVIGIQSMHSDVQAVLDVVWDTVLPVL